MASFKVNKERAINYFSSSGGFRIKSELLCGPPVTHVALWSPCPGHVEATRLPRHTDGIRLDHLFLVERLVARTAFGRHLAPQIRKAMAGSYEMSAAKVCLDAIPIYVVLNECDRLSI